MPSSSKHAPPLQKGRQHNTLTGSVQRMFLRRGLSTRIINQDHHDDRDVPPPEPPPEPPREWYQSEPIVKTSKAINTAACVLGIFYAALAFNQVSENLAFNIFYGFSSFIMSAPLSWFFTIKLIDATIRLKKKEPLYMAAYALALLCAISTIPTGLQLGKESADNFKNLPNWLRTISVILSSFNRFCTRFTGSLNVLYVIFKFSIDEYHKRVTKNRIYYQLLYDIKHYREENIVTHTLRTGDALNLKVFAHNFYQNMPNLSSPQKPGETPTHFIKKLLIRTLSFFIISVFIINMQPLWLKLTVKGVENLKPIKSWAENTTAVWFSALSDEFFYFYMAAIFLPSIFTIIEISAPKIKTKLNNSGPVKKAAILFCTAIATITWGLSAYYSGITYRKDANEAMENGFGDIADQTWFSWFVGNWTQLFMPVYSQMIATTSSGLIVNGGSTLNFLMEHLSFFKPDKLEKNYSQFDADDATRILEDLIGKHDFEGLKRKSGEDIRDSIQRDRDLAQPHQSIWSRVSCCRSQETAAEKVPLLRTTSTLKQGF